MSDNLITGLKYFFRGSVRAIAFYFIAAYIVVAVIRIYYPFELEWMEGAIVDQCRRVLDSRGIYVRPSVEFVPFIYTPLYYYVSALFMKLLGTGFAAARLVSFLSSLGSMLFLYLIVRRETRKFIPALLAASFFAAAYKFTGAWYDLAWVDSMYVCLLMASVYVVARYDDARGPLWSAVLLWIAYFTKQTTFIMVGVIGAWYLFENRKYFLYFLSLFTVLTAAIMILMYYLTNGWFIYYTLLLPRSHRLLHDVFFSFWSEYIFDSFPIFILILAAYLIFRGNINSADPILKIRLYFASFIGLLLSSYFQAVHSGAYHNSMIPAAAGIALIMGIMYSQLREVIGKDRPRWEILLMIAVILQFAVLIYLPSRLVPDEADRQTGREFLELLGSIKGEVYTIDNGFYPAMVGKKTYAHRMAIYDVIRASEIEFNGIRTSEALKNEIIRYFKERKFAAVITGDNSMFPEPGLIKQYYPVEREIWESYTHFYPVTGHRSRPEKLYLPETKNIE